MQCDLCGNPAVVHEVTIKNGVKTEIHLCAEHAKASGISLPGTAPINQVLTQFAVSKPRKARVRQKSCPACHTTLASFKKTGVLGCPECYDEFGDQLAPTIARAQNGGECHAGKCPKRGGASIDRQLEVRRLMREMEEAVAAEQYERAAELRDCLTQIQTVATEPGPAPAEKRPAS